MTARAYPEQNVLFESNNDDFAEAKTRIFGLIKKSFSHRRVRHFEEIRQQRLLQILSGRAASMRYRK